MKTKLWLSKCRYGFCGLSCMAVLLAQHLCLTSGVAGHRYSAMTSMAQLDANKGIPASGGSDWLHSEARNPMVPAWRRYRWQRFLALTQKRNANGYNYTSGISSHDKYAFQYGYAEIRAKIPKGKVYGQHSGSLHSNETSGLRTWCCRIPRSRTPRCVHDRTSKPAMAMKSRWTTGQVLIFPNYHTFVCSGTQSGSVRGWRRAQAVWNCRECSSQTNEHSSQFGCWSSLDNTPDATTPFLITMILTTLKCEK